MERMRKEQRQATILDAQRLLRRLQATEALSRRIVSWDNVHQLQQAAEYARELGQVGNERECLMWAVRITQALSTEPADQSDVNPSEMWLG